MFGFMIVLTGTFVEYSNTLVKSPFASMYIKPKRDPAEDPDIDSSSLSSPASPSALSAPIKAKYAMAPGPKTRRFTAI